MRGRADAHLRATRHADLRPVQGWPSEVHHHVAHRGSTDGRGAGRARSLRRGGRGAEERLEQDERRLRANERILAAELREIRGNRTLTVLALALAAALTVAVVSLVIALVALNRDVQAVAKAAPKDSSVGTAAVQDGAITGGKIAAGAVTRDHIAAGAVGPSSSPTAPSPRRSWRLAPSPPTGSRRARSPPTGSRGAVTAGAVAAGAVGPGAIAKGAVGTGAIAAGAVGGGQLANGAVTGAKVAANSLTGTDIDESTLGHVPNATHAATAASAAKLGGLPAGAVVAHVTIVKHGSGTSYAPRKGPITVTCPAGTRVIGGGAAIRDATAGVALVRSEPNGTTGWVATAEEFGVASAPWHLVVSAICAAGGQ